MDFRRVKELVIPEGTVKELIIGGVSIWRQSAVDYGVSITTDNAEPITGKYLGTVRKVFTADFNVPEAQQGVCPKWTVSGLPSGMDYISSYSYEYERYVDSKCEIYGYPESTGEFTVTVSVAQGSYTDSKTYKLQVAEASYSGITITTNNTDMITDFYQLRYASKRFEATFNIPDRDKAQEQIWSFSGLPSGLSNSGATLSGYAESTGTYTVTVMVRQGSYRDTKDYALKVTSDGTQLKITNTSLTSAYSGKEYSCQINTNKDSLNLAPVMTQYYASGLPSGLNIGQYSGTISGTPTNITTTAYPVTLYAIYDAYRSPDKTLDLTSYSKQPLFGSNANQLSTDYAIDFTLSAADVRDANKVGSVLCSKTGILGRYLGETKSVSIYNARYYNSSGPTKPYTFSFTGYSGEGEIILAPASASASNPVVKLSITMHNDVYKGSNYYNHMDISMTLTKKTTITVNNLKSRTGYYLKVNLASDGGTSTLTLNFSFTD